MPEKKIEGEQGTGPVRLEVESQFGRNTKQPLVRLAWGEQEGLLTVEQARELAFWLLEAIEGAMTDGMIYEFCMKEMDGSEEAAAAMIQLLRGYRAARAERVG
jgi:hypothetical protein